MLINVDALDHRKRTARERIDIWQTKVIKWYSSNSKRTHIAVAPPSTPAEIFLFLHRKISAAEKKIYTRLRKKLTKYNAYAATCTSVCIYKRVRRELHDPCTSFKLK